jgi:hypothetical protein
LSYYKDYLAGKHALVWDQIQTLSEDILQREDVYTDVLHVLYEVMKRVRTNIELLIQRLESLGYTFGYSWTAPLLAEERAKIEWYQEPGVLDQVGIPEELWEDMLVSEVLRWIAEQPITYSLPLLDIEQRLAKIEDTGRRVPLSIRAWHEIVGGVNFIGSPPQNWLNGKNEREYAYQLDPLRINSLEEKYLEQAMKDSRLEISPDKYYKYYYSGGDFYHLYLPSALIVDESIKIGKSHVKFIEYLRLALSKGGFPGLDSSTAIPEEHLLFLITDLLPF